tara:strand:- start:3487 stop:4005 length:519 start_codon:yes stop_codon:yes gene_type:complete
MNPSVWGPKLWFALHTITLNYPKKPTYQNKKCYNNFFMSLQYIIPCSTCAKNFKKHLDKYPITDYLDCRKDLVLWLIKIHNEVNKQLNKPTMEPKEALKKLSNIYKREKTFSKIKDYPWTYIIITIIGIILFITILLLIRRKKTQQPTQQYYMNGGGITNSHKQNIYYGNRF